MKNLDEMFPTDLPRIPEKVAEHGRQAALLRDVQAGLIGAYDVYDGSRNLGMIYGIPEELDALLQAPGPDPVDGEFGVSDDIRFELPDPNMLDRRIYNAKLALDVELYMAIGESAPETPLREY